MAQSRIGFNIDGNGAAVGDPNTLYMTVTQINPTLVVVQNNLELARRLKAALPACRVVYREVREGDGGWWKPEANVPPAQMAAHILSLNLGNIPYYLLNEPDTSNAPVLVKWVVDTSTPVLQAGGSIAAVNFSVGTYSPESIERGDYDPLLRLADQYPEQFFISIHEGSAGMLQFGVGQWPRQQLIDGRVQEQYWPKAAALPVARWDGNLPPYWLIRRADWFTIRAKELGLKPPRFLITEFGWDRSGEGDMLRDIAGRWGGAYNYPELLGINTYRNVYGQWFRGVPFERVVYDQLSWVNSIYPPEYEGIALFCWSFSDKWDGEGFNFGRYTALHTLLFVEPLTPPKPAEPPPTPVYGSVYPTTRLNARSAPNGAILGILEAGETLGLTGACKALGAFVWLQVRTRYGEAWVAHPYVAVR